MRGDFGQLQPCAVAKTVACDHRHPAIVRPSAPEPPRLNQRSAARQAKSLLNYVSPAPRASDRTALVRAVPGSLVLVRDDEISSPARARLPCLAWRALQKELRSGGMISAYPDYMFLAVSPSTQTAGASPISPLPATHAVASGAAHRGPHACFDGRRQKSGRNCETKFWSGSLASHRRVQPSPVQRRFQRAWLTRFIHPAEAESLHAFPFGTFHQLTPHTFHQQSQSWQLPCLGRGYYLSLRRTRSRHLCWKAHEAVTLLQSLMRHLRQVGLILNATKTKVWTTEAQPPSCLFTPGADPIQVLESEGCHKWLGCMLSTATSDAEADLDFHLQNASKAFWKHK